MKPLFRLHLICALLCFCLYPGGLRAQWNEIHVFGKTLRGLWFVNADTGFVCGGYETPFLAKTTDGGFSWEDITPDVEGPVLAVCFTDPLTGFIAWIEGASESHICKTTDGGITWSDRFSTPPRINTIVFPTPETGYVFPVAMEYANAIKSTDGGDTWIDMGFFTAPSPLLQIPDASFRESSKGYVVTGEGSVYKTVTGGTSWTLSYHNGPYSLHGIQFTGEDTGFAVGELQDCWSGNPCGLFVRTTDAGQTWNKTVLPEACFDIWFPKPDTGYIATHPMMKTANGGLSWQNDTVNTDAYPIRLFFPTPEIGYAITGYSLLKMDPDVGVGIPRPPAPFGFTVSPVPAREMITIRFQGANEPVIRAELLDNLGRVVSILTDGALPAGCQSIRADVSAFQPGVYFCKITVRNGRVTKKILIED